MKKSALMVQCEASNKYNPYTLSRYLTRDTDGTIYVDRTRAIQNKDDERLFLVVLNCVCVVWVSPVRIHAIE